MYYIILIPHISVGCLLVRHCFSSFLYPLTFFS